MAISILVSFIAGVLSFFSPCVFTIIPGFLAYLAGISVKDLQGKSFNKQIFLNTLFYVLGFSLVFAVLGILIGTVLSGASIQVRDWLRRIGGVIIVLFGLYLVGILRIPILDREYKVRVHRQASYTTSFFFGVTFAVGWTPCIGAVLGSIFTLAAANPASSFFLLLAYSLGLSMPFLLVGVFYSSASRFIKLSAKYTRTVSIILGIILIIIGVLMFTNNLLLIEGTPLFAKFI